MVKQTVKTHLSDLDGNRLDQWRASRDLTRAGLAEMLGVKPWTAARYCLPRDDARFQSPRHDIMRRIENVTRGAVTASDMLPHPRRGKRRTPEKVPARSAAA